jgi:hypothetical protein
MVVADMPLWTSDDCVRWRAALDAYPARVAARDERLPELDAWYRDELPRAIAARSPSFVTLDELVRIATWKMKRGVWRGRNLALVRGNDAALVERLTRDAFSRPGPREPLRALEPLAGVGPATASAVLSPALPDRFPFFDEDVAAQIPSLGAVAFTAPYYERYAAALIARAAGLRARCGPAWTAELVGRALWSEARAGG